MMKVLLADDDRELVEILRYVFQREGYNVLTAADGQSCVAHLSDGVARPLGFGYANAQAQRH